MKFGDPQSVRAANRSRGKQFIEGIDVNTRTLNSLLIGASVNTLDVINSERPEERACLTIQVAYNVNSL